MRKFNVLVFEPNRRSFEPYDVLPYFRRCYADRIERSAKASDPEDEYVKVPTTREEFKKFVKSESQYQFWARCEYEVILLDWPCQKVHRKWDVHEQIMMNLDTITDILFEEIGD